MSTLTLWTPEQTQLISTTIAPGCSNDELRLFAYACQLTGLDPFSRQIYAIKRGGKLTIQVSIDGLRSIAERTGQLDGSQSYWCGPDGAWVDVWLDSKPPAAAKTIIHRKGCAHPFSATARFADFNAGQGLWSKMPSVMIAKCSEAQALRRAFPADLSGVYSTDEMDQAVEPVTVSSAPALPTMPAGDSKVFTAGKAAIAKAANMEALAKVTERMEARKGDLSTEQQETLLALALEKEASFTTAEEADPFDD